MPIESVSPAGLGTPAVFLALAVAATASAADGKGSPFLIGYCTTDLAKTKAAGFDFAEIRIREFVKLSDEDFDTLVAANKAVGLPTPAGYTFLPNDLKVVGPDVDLTKVMAYMTKAFARCERLGIRIIVFGSPDARRAPAGFSKDEAFSQLVALGKRIAPEAAKHGIVVMAEPICSAQTNMVNTVADGLAWVDAVAHPNFQFMVDLYHLVEQGEEPKALRAAGARLKYAKIANPKGRVMPLSSDEYDYAGYLRVLREVGYEGPLGMETSPDKLETEGPKAIAFLRTAWAAAAPAKPR